MEQIERYRQQHGVNDKEHAFGAEPEGQGAKVEREYAQQRLRLTQRQLGLDCGRERSHDLGQELGGGMETGM